MRYAWLCHPVTIAGVVVLLVNDHLLKQSWPGFVTGKLSDVAGLVVAPALVALLFLRRADLAATVLTGALFTVVKTTETGAELASHAWTLVGGPSRVLVDPTDLLALPALVLAWWVRRSTLHRPSSARWRIVVTMPLALLAVTATAAAPPPSSADAVELDAAGRIHVHTTDMRELISEDGGRSWTESPREQPGRGQSAQCVPGQATRCYQVLGDRLGVRQSDDGGRSWQTAWTPSENDLERLARQHGSRSGLRSLSLAVQPRPGGHVVVVANGVDGIAVRDPSGTWRRVGWPGTEAAEADLSSERGVALFLAACMAFGGAGAGLRRHTGLYTGCASAAALGLLLPVSSGSMLDLAFSQKGPYLLLGLLAGLTGAVVCLVLAFAGRARPVPAVTGLLAAPLVYAGIRLPFEGWAKGTPDSYAVAVALAVLLAGAVVAASAAVIGRDARHTSGRSTSAG
ncbi:hypothetical protein FAF44_03995 [Nonomuraea sp. MG754425]|uniref:hypothetical protein n=1 Tax=Nonomuraea sp. MG754425 TaxID=2570319 RepID=UPI001F2D7742|nr:hypothetical protein [Nonomuraea sp. MG754425]MCF6467576.1 hypothetical protein [Nonomuraea sp. MG754425]